MAARRQTGGVGEVLPSPGPRSDIGASLDDVIAGLVDLDLKGLRLQWRNHLGGIPPAHLPRWLLLRVLAYQIQVAALGGPDKATLRVIRQPKGQTLDSAESRPFEARIPSTREGTTLKAGAMLVREWRGRLERVKVLEKGFAWNGKSYASLSQIAKTMTGTSWNGHRFFGLRTSKSNRAARPGRCLEVDVDVRLDFTSEEPTPPKKVDHRSSSLGDANAPTARNLVAHGEGLCRDTTAAAS
jgi:hypothetical protein